MILTSLRKFVLRFEDNIPVVFNWMRYIFHVVIKGDIVYPSVTKKIFRLIDSSSLIAIDVGANVGIVTRYLSQYFVTTHAIEPLPYLSDRLCHIQNDRIKVHQCAVGSVDGRITMRTPVSADGQYFHALSTASTLNSLSLFEHQHVVEREVAQYKLSTLISKDLGRVGYIKIDVEGFEYAVLIGALEIIMRDRPVLQVEIACLHNPEYLNVLDLLAKSEYTGYSITNHGLKENVFESLGRQSLNTNISADSHIDYQYDFLFIANEKIDLFKEIIS